jgi:1-deoxypentalenic acid 11beta-hydroxylase
MTESTGMFEAANDRYGDHDALQEFFEREGYLFFKGILDREQLSPVAQRATAELQRQGLLTSEGKWSGAAIETMDEPRLHEVMRYDEFWNSAPTIEFFEKVFGTEVYVFAQTQTRVMIPAVERYQTPPHQDGAYISSDAGFRTCWVPLCDAPVEMGGLTIAQRSHVKGLRTHVTDDFYESFTQGLKTAGVRLEPDEEQWLTADYELGDVVIFHPFMVHRSAPNVSADGVRISMDTRVQPAASERGYVATHTAMEIRDEIRSKQGWYQEVAFDS